MLDTLTARNSAILLKKQDIFGKYPLFLTKKHQKYHRFLTKNGENYTSFSTKNEKKYPLFSTASFEMNGLIGTQ